MDFALAILPWHAIMGLNMKRKEKLTVAFGLSLGILYVLLPFPLIFSQKHLLTFTSAGVCSIIRTYELQALSSLDEYVYDTVPMLLWSSTEVLATIICACIPVLRPLYVKLIYGSRGDSSGGPSYPLSDFGPKKSSGHYQSKDHSGGGASKIYIGPANGGLTTRIRHIDDNTSEESILGDQNHGLPIHNFEEMDAIARADGIVITKTTYIQSERCPV